MENEIAKFHEMVKDIKIAMMTTRRADGHLVSRAMSTQKQAPGADLWFAARADSGKIGDLEADPHVNLAYYKDRTREWISVCGIATVTRDRETIRRLYESDWKAWFGDEGDPRDGTPDDTRIALIGVQVHSAVFLEVNKPQPVVLYELVKGWVTGAQPDIGTMHRVGH